MSQGPDFRLATAHEMGLWDSMEVLASAFLGADESCEYVHRRLYQNKELVGEIELASGEEENTLFTVTARSFRVVRTNWADFSKRHLDERTAIEEIRFKDLNSNGLVDLVAARASDDSLYTYVLDNGSEMVYFDEANLAFYLTSDTASK